jgi:hypothetical protein
MSIPKKFIEWRQLPAAPTWHLFLGNKSFCGRETSNGHFNFAEKKPANDAKICRLCVKDAAAFKERIKEII